MTTIAWKYPFLAADRAYVANDVIVAFGDKLYALHQGVFAGAGSASVCAKVLKYLDQCEKPDQEEEPERPILTKDEPFKGILVSFGRKYPVVLEPDLYRWEAKCRYFALGTGADFAMGAMAAGVDAPTAVWLASLHCVWTTPPFDIWDMARRHFYGEIPADPFISGDWRSHAETVASQPEAPGYKRFVRP